MKFGAYKKKIRFDTTAFAFYVLFGIICSAPSQTAYDINIPFKWTNQIIDYYLLLYCHFRFTPLNFSRMPGRSLCKKFDTLFSLLKNWRSTVDEVVCISRVHKSTFPNRIKMCVSVTVESFQLLSFIIFCIFNIVQY